MNGTSFFHIDKIIHWIYQWIKKINNSSEMSMNKINECLLNFLKNKTNKIHEIIWFFDNKRKCFYELLCSFY